MQNTLQFLLVRDSFVQVVPSVFCFGACRRRHQTVDLPEIPAGYQYIGKQVKPCPTTRQIVVHRTERIVSPRRFLYKVLPLRILRLQDWVENLVNSMQKPVLLFRSRHAACDMRNLNTDEIYVLIAADVH